MSLKDTTVAVLGLGAMGLPMATNLANCGATVRGYDIAQARLDLAKDAGVEPAGSAQDAARGAQVVLVAVRNAEQLDNALYGEDGVVAVMAERGVVILTSTVGIEAVQAVAAKLAETGHQIADAPVSGGPARAGEGDLLVTVGADDSAWDAAHPVLDAMAGKLVRMGNKAGDGQAMKTVNQLLCGVHIAVAGEALALADALGLDPAIALDTLMGGAAASFMLGDRGQRMLEAYTEEGPEVKSRVDIFTKDMGIVTDAAKAVKLATPIACAAQSSFLIAEAQGRGAQDDSMVITVVAPEKRG